MRIQVKLFAILREMAGTSELQLELPAAASISQLRESIASTRPELASALPKAAVAINRSYATSDAKLCDGDEVAFIPPVSGG